MNRNKFAATAGLSLACMLVFILVRAQAQDAKTPYPSMAALEKYLMADRNEEISLARSAAPTSVSADAEVMVLGRKGYETAVKGKNGFVCIVERSWASGLDDPGFWNPKLRAPLCLNAPAARTYLPITIMKTNLVLAGQSKAQMSEAMKAAFEKKELPEIERGAMCYMMSKEQYLGDQNGHWYPHLMFFLPSTEAAAWGANLPGSPIIMLEPPPGQLTVFLVPLWKWSDGTPSPLGGSHTTK